jgi:membrane fusion protein (multidrug efflux system)
MKTLSILPLAVTGVIGSVFLIHINAAPPATPAVVMQPAVEVPCPIAAPASAHANAGIAGRVIAGVECDVKSRSAGEVLRVHVDTGDVVKQGQLLVELDPSDAQNQLVRAQAALTASKARLTQARESLEIAELCLQSQRTRADAGIRASAARSMRARSRADRMKATLSKMVTSQEQYDEAEAVAVEAAANLDLSKTQLDDLKTQQRALALKHEDVACAEAQAAIDELGLQEAQTRLADKNIVAPIDGTVSANFVKPGQVIAAGTNSSETRLLTLSNTAKLYVVANPSACQTRKLKPGQRAVIRSEALPDERFSAAVLRATPCAKECAYSLKLEVLGDNRGLLAPEMPVTVEIGE